LLAPAGSARARSQVLFMFASHSGVGQVRVGTIRRMGRWAPALIPVVATIVVAGCGGARTSAPQTTTSSTAAPLPSQPPPSPATTSTTAAPPLQGEAASGATGDIPDNQVFLVFRNRAGRYTMKYPEGWVRQGTGKEVVFRDKNNIVRILIAAGLPPTVASVRRELAAQPALQVTQPPQAVGGAKAVKVVYRTQSAPNPVTGKRVVLTVDRYYLAHDGKTAVVDLGTPVGVDNVDAYRLMIESFRWR